MELTWNDVALSIQQAYELLIDNIECSLEEYRVYSQLVRYGYRIQRFVYNSEKNIKGDENSCIKRKVIVEPERGLWRTSIREQNKDCVDVKSVNSPCDEKPVSSPKRTDIKISDLPAKNSVEDENISNNVLEVVDDLLHVVENIEARSKNIECEKQSAVNAQKSNTILKTVNTGGDKKKQNPRVEIISDETLLGNIKIVTDHLNDCTKRNNIPANWRASRIQRNVKLVPRRTDKLLPATDSLDSNTKNSECNSGKHKLLSPSKENSQFKKSKHEVLYNNNYIHIINILIARKLL